MEVDPNQTGEPIQVEEREGFIVPVLPEGLFQELRAPRLSREVLEEVVSDPAKYGSEHIQRLLTYLKPELKDPGGIIQVQSRRFMEVSNEGPWSNCFEFSFARSFYDSKVITGAWLTLLGVHFETGSRLNAETLRALPKVGVLEICRRPYVQFADGDVLDIDSSVFRVARMELSEPFRIGFYLSVGLAGYESIRRIDGRASLHAKALGAGASPWHQSLTLSTDEVQPIERFSRLYDQPGYIATVSKYRSGTSAGVRLQNQGPSEFWLRFELKK